MPRNQARNSNRQPTRRRPNPQQNAANVGYSIKGPVDPNPVVQCPWWPFTIQGNSVAGMIEWKGSDIAASVQSKLRVGFQQIQIRLRHVKVWGKEEPAAESNLGDAYLNIYRNQNADYELCALRDSGGRNRRPMVGWVFGPVDRTTILRVNPIVMRTSGSSWEISGWVNSRGSDPPALLNGPQGRIIMDESPSQVNNPRWSSADDDEE